jgi:hypothetical protein
MVRAVARDAKAIGDGVGGAKVTIVNVATGEVLAEGLQQGGTGDTEAIMSTPRVRDAAVYEAEGTAGFLAELTISRPTVVNISAIGPLGYPQAVRAATKQMLLVPGQDVLGDGVVLELHGFIVEIVSPLPLDPVNAEVQVSARVRMMCGCTIEPDGTWDANAKTIVALLKADGRVVSQAELVYAGATSMFAGALVVPFDVRGDLTLDVIATEAGAGNFGRHEIPLGAAR